MVERDYEYPIEFYKKRFFWGAVFAGLLLTFAVQITLALLGLSIGLSIVPKAAETGNMTGLSISAAIWWFLSGLVALYFGAWISGRMANTINRRDGAIHGMVMWALAIVLMLLFATSTVGALVGGSFSILRSSMSSMAQVAPALSNLKIPGAEMPNLGNAMNDPQIRDMANKMIKEGPDSVNKDEFVNLLASKGNMSQEDAKKKIDDLTNKYNEAKQNVQEGVEKAKEVGQTAMKVSAAGALGSFLMLVFGALVSAWGGAAGVREDL